MTQSVYIGISGWRYDGWKGKFYPKTLPASRELRYASSQVRSVEVNGSFYSLQSPSSYRAWAKDVPDDFIFAVKGPRFITHLKQLNEVKVPLANFFASGVLTLGEKLGPILWQFPERFRFQPEKFENFFALLPRTFDEANRLAKKHDYRVPRGAYARQELGARLLRHAVEVRNETFRTPEFLRLLQKNRIALVVSDAGKRWPLFDAVTADFAYARLHGGQDLYAGGYGPKALLRWAKRMRCWLADARIRDVYIYFDNDAKVRAPADAIALQKLWLELSALPSSARAA